MEPIRAGVVTVSDKGYAGEREDASGPLLAAHLAPAGSVLDLGCGRGGILAFNEPLFRLACLLERVMPPLLRVHLVGEYVAVQVGCNGSATLPSHRRKY